MAGNNLPQNRNILDERDIHGGHHFAAQRGRYAAHAGERKQEKHRSAAAQKVDGDTGQDIVDLELEDDISQHIAAERPGQHARQKTEPCAA